MPPSELDVRASLFTLLSTRRDIDILVFELLGRYNVDRLTGSQIPEHADRLNFGLACQLAFIFDLQRTHLQSRTPFGGGDTSSITERLPYLLSFQAAKGAFECVSQLARDFIQRFDGHQGIDVSSKRNVFLRALVSGARMLCLHPGVRPGETVVPAPFEEGEFSFWESTLTEVCNAALSKVPERHPGLQLPRMGRQMFPMDDSRLMKVTKECTTDILSNSAYKYWTLYDISCSVVTAYIQHREIANSEDADILDENAELLLGLLAAGIADSAAAEALRVYKTAGRGERCAVMLMDIVEVLNPILMEHPCEPCSTGYETITRHPRYSDHSSIYEVQDPCKIPTLKKFQEVLNQRGLVLRDSDNELPTLLSKMDRVCSEIANTHVRPSNRPGGFSDDGGRITEILEHTPISPTGYSGGDNRPMETLRLYAANCESTHIIAHSPTISAMVEDAEDQRQTWNDGSLTIPSGAICPFCPNSPHPKLIHNLREISPLNQVLGVAIQKRQNLEQLRRSRETRFMQGMASPITIFRSSVPEVGLHPVPRQHHNSYIPDIPEVVEPLGEQRNTTTVSIDDLPKPVGASGWKRFKNTIRIGKKSDTASTVSGSLMNGNSSMGHIDLLHLQNKASGDVNVTLSFDCERLVTWNNTNLALHDVSGREAIRLLMLGVSPVKDPDIILASRSYCAIVRRGPSHDEARSIQSLALSPDDTHAAVGLMNGAAQVLELDQQTGKIMVRGLPVLSFLQLNRDGTRQRHATAPVVALSFSPDGSQLAATVRDGTAASTYMSPRPFTQLTGPYIDRSLGVREDDDQGVSSAICCAERNLLCVTYWTRSGIPLLIDYASRKSRQLDNRTIKLDIGTRIQQAVFSRSGHALILINNKGSIFKITIDDIDHIRAEEIGGSRVLSRVIGKSQILDMKIAADERSLKVVWVKNSSRAVVNSYPL